MKKYFDNNRGVTLVEIIVSIALLGIIVTPLASFFVNSIKTNILSEQQAEANQLAQSYMEEYRGKAFSELLELMNYGSLTFTQGEKTVEVNLAALSEPAVPEQYSVQVLVNPTAGTIAITGEDTFNIVYSEEKQYIISLESNFLRLAEAGNPEIFIANAALEGTHSGRLLMLMEQTGPSNLIIQVVNFMDKPLNIHRVGSDGLTVQPRLGEIRVEYFSHKIGEADSIAAAGLVIEVIVKQQGRILTELHHVKMMGE